MRYTAGLLVVLLSILLAVTYYSAVGHRDERDVFYGVLVGGGSL
ncbi:hypothetical protein [Thermococcus peptonophilus]